MKKIILSFALLFAAATAADAAKANPRRMTVTLEDGRTVLVAMRGDEHFHYLSTTRGELIIRNADNTFRTATDAETALFENRCAAADRQRAAQNFPVNTRPFPHTGNPKALVIMMEFSDYSFTHTPEEIDRWLNAKGYVEKPTSRSGYGSVAQYFEDCSDGKFRPQFDVVGPFKTSKQRAYYGENDASGSDNKSRIAELIREAALQADDSGVDFSQYDSDNDGYVDLVYVVYAGCGEQSADNAPDLMWAKSGYYTTLPKLDGKQIYRYGISNELYGEGTAMDGIGVFCHEFCHTLGLPDVYPTWSRSNTRTEDYDNQSMEYWDLMDAGEYINGGYYPMPLTAWEREWLGWAEPMENMVPGDYTMAPLFMGGKGLRLQGSKKDDNDEFYILENVPAGKNTGWYIPQFGRGLIVTHINYNEQYFRNFSHPNNEKLKPRWTIVPANGTLLSSYRDDADERRENYAGNPFPGKLNVTSLTDWRAYDKDGITVALHDIRMNDDGTVSFRCVDTSTGIAAVSDADTRNADTHIFTVDGKYAGRDISVLPKGIYIVGGRKIVK